MAGTREGGLKAALKNKERDPDFYARIGAKGGRSGVGPDYRLGGEKALGFAANPELARIAGMKGGKISKRGPGKNGVRNNRSRTIRQDLQGSPQSQSTGQTA